MGTQKRKELDRHRPIGEGVGFDRIRRITGYLVGDANKFNNSKRAEVEARVKHK